MPSKKTASTSGVTREKHTWGVRLLMRPFTDPRQNTLMELSAEISQGKPGSSPSVKIWFSGVPVSGAMPLSDTQVWVSALQILQAEARKEYDEIKSSKKPVKKKAAKK